VNHRKLPHVLIAALLFSLSATAVVASEYPEIRVLTRDDLLFVQHQAEVENYYRLSKVVGGAELPPLGIFTYRRKKAEDLFALNARLGLPYDGLATLNGAADARAFNALVSILIPTQPGLFVHLPPRTPLEQMVLSSRQAAGIAGQPLVVTRAGGRETLAFFPGEMFNSVERAYFLGILFQFPITFSVVKGLITSRYGMRRDPFSGRQEFHNGLDIGAAEGTPVRAAREGVVSEAGSSDVLGRYIVISHPGGWETVYGHLSTIRGILKAEVQAGEQIGQVGMTGRATGSHLHFEVRRKGSATDPFPLLAAGREKR
jgi:murein DD-endopeptidase MepM/ murein hydrolase activator NlpD